MVRRFRACRDCRGWRSSLQCGDLRTYRLWRVEAERAHRLGVRSLGHGDRLGDGVLLHRRAQELQGSASPCSELETPADPGDRAAVEGPSPGARQVVNMNDPEHCRLYTSDAADH